MRLFYSLLRNTAGNTAMLFGLLLFPVLGMVGLAVDTSRAYAVKQQLQTALDAAALAGGRMYGLSTRDQVIQNYFDTNWDASRFGATASPLDIQINRAAGTLTVGATATFPTIFAKFVGVSQMTVNASVEAIKNETTLEVAIAIDTTGSMNSNDRNGVHKMTAARDAANLLLNILYNYQDDDDHVFVSIVPFVQNVNVGSGYSSWLVNNSLSQISWSSSPFNTSSWRGCMVERLNDTGTVVYDTSDETPVTQRFMPYADHHFGPNCPQWTAGEDGTVIGTCRMNNGFLYTATTTGTTGSSAPTHTSGTSSDGNVSWAFGRSAYPVTPGYAPVSCPLWAPGQSVTTNACRMAPHCPDWQAGRSISSGECVSSYGRIYTASTGGTTSGAVGPSHSSGSTTSGGINWTYRSELCPTNWSSGQSITAGDCRRSNVSPYRTYIATTSGNKSNSTVATHTSGTASVGGITWQVANHNCMPWATSQSISTGDCRRNGSRTYVANSSGTTSGSTGPTHTSGTATSGGISWIYNNTYEPSDFGQNIYYATGNGTTGSIPPTNTVFGTSVSDGGVSWQLYSRLWTGNQRIYTTGTANMRSNIWFNDYDPRGTGLTTGTTPPQQTSGTSTSGGISWRSQGDIAAQVSAGGQYGGGYNSGCGTPIVPMTTSRLTAKATVDVLAPSTAYGGTMTSMGLIWAWRTISPLWRNLWSGVPAERPMLYTEPNNYKAVVILTDGENVFSDCSNDRYCRASGTPYGYLADGRLGATNSAAAVTAINNKVRGICQNIRNAAGTENPIRIYAVMFDLPAGASGTRTLFTECVGDSARFFDAVDASQLEQAFQTIGVDLAQLRLSH